MSATTAASAFLEMARVLRPWGREGAVAVLLSTDRPEERFRAGVVLEAHREGETSRSLTVAWWRPRRAGAVLKFREIEEIDAAEDLRGLRLGLPRASADAAFGRRVLLDDLLGLPVESPLGTRLGAVVDIEEAGPQVLLVLETEGGEALVPLHPKLCEIDLRAGRIVASLPEGLLPRRG